MYCRTYFNAIPLHSYKLIGNLSDFTSSVTDSFDWYYIFLPLVSIVGYAFYSFNRNISRKLPSIGLYVFYCVGLGIIVWASDAVRGGTYKKIQWLSEYTTLASTVTPIYSLGGFLYYDYQRSNETLTSKEIEEVRDWLETHKKFTDPYWNDSIRLNRKETQNLVLILWESLESWPIGLEVEGQEITPNLNKLLKDSSTFYAPNIVTQVGPGRSIDGQLMAVTGLLPMKNQVYAYNAVLNKYFSLEKAFSEAGGKSYQLTGDKPYTWNQAPVTKSFGVDTLIHSEKFIHDEFVGKRLSDGSLLRQITAKLQAGEIWPENEKAMLVVVTNSSHHPFKLPEKFKTLKLKKEYPEIVINYLNAIHYTDSSLSGLIEYLKNRSDRENTMIVITGDHEGLTFDRRQAIADPRSRQFVDSLQHTPMIILNSPVAGKFENQMGQADIYSSILDLLNLKDYEWRGMGVSIFDPDHPGFAVGSAGEVIKGDKPIDPDWLKHLKEGREISDRILKFNLLEHYPDSIAPSKH